MSKKTKSISVTVVDDPTNRNVQFRFQTKRVRDPETGKKTETTELHAVTMIDVALEGRVEQKVHTEVVDDALDAAGVERSTMTLDEAIDFFHANAETKLGYV